MATARTHTKTAAPVAAKAASTVQAKAAPRRQAAPAKTSAKAPAAKKSPSAASKSSVPAAKIAKSPKTTAPKPAKQKLVRDSFTIPRAEYAALGALKERLVQLAQPAKKSEVLRAGIKLLSAQTDAALLAALAAVPSIKTGRPKKAK